MLVQGYTQGRVWWVENPLFWKQKYCYLKMTISGSYQIITFTPVQIIIAIKF